MLPPMFWLLIAIANAADPVPFACCDDDKVSRVVELYLKLHKILAAGDGKPTAVGYLLLSASDQLAKSKLGDSDRETAKELSVLVKSTYAKEDKLRAAMPEISRHVVYLALNHADAEGSLKLVRAACKGGPSWIQKPGKLLIAFKSNGDCQFK
jgi:hypothetical protein